MVKSPRLDRTLSTRFAGRDPDSRTKLLPSDPTRCRAQGSQTFGHKSSAQRKVHCHGREITALKPLLSLMKFFDSCVLCVPDPLLLVVRNRKRSEKQYRKTTPQSKQNQNTQQQCPSNHKKTTKRRSSSSDPATSPRPSWSI